MAERTPEHPNTERANTGEPHLAAFASWAVLFASFGLSAATWIAIATLAGFTGQWHLRTNTGVFAVHLSWLMPIAVDGYVITALVLWTAPVPARVAAFARTNTYAAASLGVVAQSAYHCATIATSTGTAWQAVMAAVVGAVPPGVAALAVHMRALLRREAHRTNERTHTATRTDTVRRSPQPPVRPAAPVPVPNTAPAVQANATPPNGANEQAAVVEANVRPITSARPRPNGTKPNTASRTEKLQKIKDACPEWRTNTPSVRKCAEILGLSVASAHPYQKDLVAQANTEQPVPTTGGEADPGPLDHDPADLVGVSA